MKIFMIFLIALLGVGNSDACDVCGCSLAGPKIGILPQSKSHYIGVRYGFATFDASMTYNSVYTEDEFSNDTYQRVDVLGKYHINDRFQVKIVIPYLINEMDGSHQDVVSKGLGDPMFLLLTRVMDTGLDFSRTVNHALFLGGGVKLPVGDYEKMDENGLINRNFQLGSGSLDYVFALNYTLRFGGYGMTLDASYKLNTQNDVGYDFGDQTHTSLAFFKLQGLQAVSFLHAVGSRFEFAHSHLDQGIKQINTGGNVVLGHVSTQMYYKAFTIQAEFQYPLVNKFNSDAIAHIDSGSRMTMDVLYHF